MIIIFKKNAKNIIYNNSRKDMLILKDISKDDDLIMKFKPSDNNITIKEYFKWILGNHNILECIKFNDNSYIHANQRSLQSQIEYNFIYS